MTIEKVAVVGGYVENGRLYSEHGKLIESFGEREALIFMLLLKHAPNAVSCETIHEEVWQKNGLDSNVEWTVNSSLLANRIQASIVRMRKKLRQLAAPEDEQTASALIATVPNEGYRLDCSVVAHSSRSRTNSDLEHAQFSDRFWQALETKLCADFELSLLNDPGSLRKGIRDVQRSTIALAGEAEWKVTSALEIDLYSTSFLGTLASAPHRRLGDRVLRVSCACNSVAAVATFMSMEKRLRLNIALNYHTLAGREQLRLLQDEEFDVLVVGNPAYTFSNHKQKYRYHRKLAVHKERDQLLARPGYVDEPINQIVCPIESCTHEIKELANRGEVYIPHSTSSPNFELKFPSEIIVSDGEGLDIDVGKGILCWDPLAQGLKEKLHLERVPNFDYAHTICLYVREGMIDPQGNSLERFLTDLFVSEWNYCRIHQAGALELLANDTSYLTRFAQACRL